jgi:ferredoxin
MLWDETRVRLCVGTGFAKEKANSPTVVIVKGASAMAFVVCEPCHDCKYTDCVVVCPCDCFYQDDAQLYIDPEYCIDCDACTPECPVDAIFPEFSVPAQWTHFVQLNAERVLALKESGGRITEKCAPKMGPGCQGRC